MHATCNVLSFLLLQVGTGAVIPHFPARPLLVRELSPLVVVTAKETPLLLLLRFARRRRDKTLCGGTWPSVPGSGYRRRRARCRLWARPCAGSGGGRSSACREHRVRWSILCPRRLAPFWRPKAVRSTLNV
ncbi:hypothetical protein BC826DRAFT_995935 [Russula brevipes]|nr:hypothetical protein BC826DRAFT_995935 [Russula brevipes]